MQICNDTKKGLYNMRSFIGIHNFYPRHIHNFAYLAAPLKNHIKKLPLDDGPLERKSVFKDGRGRCSPKCRGVLRSVNEIIPIADASDVGRSGAIYQSQDDKMTDCHHRTFGLNRDGCLKHD